MWDLQLVNITKSEALCGDNFLNMKPIRATRGIFAFSDWVLDADTGAGMYLHEGLPFHCNWPPKEIIWPGIDEPMILTWAPTGISVRFGTPSQGYNIGYVDMSHSDLYVQSVRNLTFTKNGTKCPINDVQWDGKNGHTVVIIVYEMVITLRISWVDEM